MNFLNREHTVAPPGFNRWLVPPAAIAAHMCIGQVYGFSVFNKPLMAELGVPVSQIQWAYSIALLMLGLSAAVFGKWVERSGPRRTIAAACEPFGLYGRCTGSAHSLISKPFGKPALASSALALSTLYS